MLFVAETTTKGMTVEAICQKCKRKNEIDIKDGKEGFRLMMCGCGYGQLVYIKVVTRKVPQVIGYAKDVTWCIQE